METNIYFSFFTRVRHKNLVHIFTPHFFKIHFNIILPYTGVSPKCFVPFFYFDKNVVCIPRLTHPALFALPSTYDNMNRPRVRLLSRVNMDIVFLF
jgi:hypothetical protein